MFKGIILKITRLREQNKLSYYNLILYKQIVKYIKHSSSLSIYEKEESLNDILDMMLQAQSEEKSMDFIIGKDYEVFCNNIIKEYEMCKSKTYRVFNVIHIYLNWLIVMFFFTAIGHFLKSSILAITLEDFMLIILIVFIIIPMAKRGEQKAYYVKYSEKSPLRINVNKDNEGLIIFILGGFVYIILTYILKIIYGNGFLNYTLYFKNYSSIILIMIISMILIYIYKIIYRKRA